VEADCVTELPAALLEPVADRIKVHAIVKALDADANGDVSAAEVKVLFAQLTGLHVEDIPDDHEDVVKFAGMELNEMENALSVGVSAEKVPFTYDKLASRT